MPAKKTAFEFMCEIFTQAKDNKTFHEKGFTKLLKAYDKVPFDEFFEAYEKCLKISLSFPQKNRQIENALDFAALFATKLNFQEVNVDEICPFLENLFELLMVIHESPKPGVRYRVCYFLNLLLTKMHDDAYLSDEWCDKITEAMMIRIMDKSPKVRTQAVYAMHRMQEPYADQCKVIKVYLFHLAFDPSPEVRKAVIKNLGKNRKTLEAVLERTHDIDDSVKKMAYLFLCKVTAKSLKIKERQAVMKNGLQGKEEIVKVVRDLVLPTWLDGYNNSITDLLYALDSEIDPDTGSLVLKALFQRMEIDDLIKQLPIDPDTKLIPIEQLTSDNVLFWRCFAKFLQDNSNNDLLEDTIPELCHFSDYIRKYQEMIQKTNYGLNEKITQQAILHQLFEITKLYDLSDEVGRNYLKKLIEDTLMSDIAEAKLIEFIVHHYKKVVPNVTSRVNTLTHIINDMRMPSKHSDDINLQAGDEEKNDARTMNKCLRIMYAMLESLTVPKVTPIIRSLFNNVALPSIDHADAEVQLNALRAVGICLAMDLELAKKHISMFFLIFTSTPESPDSWVIALNVIFEVLLVHGLDPFELVNANGEDDDGDGSRNNTAAVSFEASHADTPNNHIIKMLMGLMDYEVEVIQVAAVAGFCRLLLKARINSVQLLTRLLLLLHNPVYESHTNLRQHLVAFFEYYPLFNKENQQIIEGTFFLVLREIFDADDDQPLSNIEPCDVARFILDITRYKIYKGETEDKHYAVHNNLTLKILRESINPNSEFDLPTLVKCLQFVDIKITDDTVRAEMIRCAKTVLEELSISHKTLVQGFKMFIKKVKAGMQVEEEEEVAQNVAGDEEDNEEEDEDRIEDDSDPDL